MYIADLSAFADDAGYPPCVAEDLYGSDVRNGVIFPRLGAHDPNTSAETDTLLAHHKFGTPAAPWHLAQVILCPNHYTSSEVIERILGREEASYCQYSLCAATKPLSPTTEVLGAFLRKNRSHYRPHECPSASHECVAVQNFITRSGSTVVLTRAQHSVGSHHDTTQLSCCLDILLSPTFVTLCSLTLQAIQDSSCHTNDIDAAQIIYVYDYCYYMWWLSALRVLQDELIPSDHPARQIDPGEYLIKVCPGSDSNACNALV